MLQKPSSAHTTGINLKFVPATAKLYNCPQNSNELEHPLMEMNDISAGLWAELASSLFELNSAEYVT